MINKVKIGALEYDVILKKDPILVNNQGCYGCIEYDDLKINIGSDFAKPLKMETLIHEVLHGIIRERNLELEDEELIVTEISKGLHQVMIDNNHLLELFMNEEKNHKEGINEK